MKMMANMTHMVIKTAAMEETRKFWESVLLCKNGAADEENYLRYDVGSFTVMFDESKKAERNLLHVIGHVGFEFESKSHIDSEFERISQLVSGIKKPIGGMKQGPYRFYIDDPNGIKIEFETWEGSSD